MLRFFGIIARKFAYSQLCYQTYCGSSTNYHVILIADVLVEIEIEIGFFEIKT